MNDDQKRKLEMARAAQTSKALDNVKNEPGGVSIFVNAELDELYKKLDALLTSTSEKIDESGERMAETTKVNLIELNNHLVKVTSLMERTASLLGEKRIEEVIVKNLPKQVREYDDTNQIKELVENRKAISALNKGLGLIADQIGDGLEGLKPEQTPDAFVPFRRVYKSGNRLMFDDTQWNGSGGGAGASSSSSGGSVIIQDAGGEQATVTGGKLDVNATASLAGSSIPISGATTAVGVAIVDTSGNQIASFGGGTQYTEGDTDATITGTAVMWEDGSDTLRAVSAAKPLPIGDAGGSITVDGTFWQATQPVSGTVTANIGTVGTLATAAKQDTGNTSLASIDGKITAVNTGAVVIASGTTAVTQATAANLNAQVAGDIAAASADSGNPVKAGAKYNATFPTYTDGNRTDLQADIRGSLKSTLIIHGTNTAVAGSGDTLDDVATSATTNKIMTVSRNTVFDGTTWDRMRGDSTDGVLVNLGSNNDVTVTGSVTANAGTNLNTSTLALEAGGNLAAAATSLGVMDDWDESDRAKVNPIAGQAGVQGASGTVTALTQRVVLATDVALPAGTNAIGKLAANSGVDIGDVDVTSSALPTGASTAAKQPALGTAGTASTDVITIQGIASMTKLLVTPDANSAVNVAQINGVTPLMGAGNTGTGSPRVTIATDQAAVKVTQTPAATGGLSTMMATSADGSTALTSTAQAIKASAGQLFGWYIFNPNSVIAYVNLYNVAFGSVTVGTTNPLTMLAIPPSSAANAFSDSGIAFGTAMSVAAVMTTAGGTTAPTVALEANFFYA